MTKFDALQMAVTLMEEHGLADWDFKFSKGKNLFGYCSHVKRTISLSYPLTLLNDASQVRDTLLHEIAHALVGRGHGHGQVWKAKAEEIGARPVRCYSQEDVNTPIRKYVGTCQTEGCVGHTRHRRAIRPVYCLQCLKAAGYTKRNNYKNLFETTSRSSMATSQQKVEKRRQFRLAYTLNPNWRRSE
jgi:predicted SprT family Zn-dependent metalloprotease